MVKGQASEQYQLCGRAHQTGASSCCPARLEHGSALARKRGHFLKDDTPDQVVTYVGSSLHCCSSVSRCTSPHAVLISAPCYCTDLIGMIWRAAKRLVNPAKANSIRWLWKPSRKTAPAIGLSVRAQKMAVYINPRSFPRSFVVGSTARASVTSTPR